MQVVSEAQAGADLGKLLRAVEAGEQFVIARGEKWVARLLPITTPPPRERPKVGEMITPPFETPPAALAALTRDELRQWGL